MKTIGLIDAGGAVSVRGPLGLDTMLGKLLKDKELNKSMGEAAGKFVNNNGGAAAKIIRFIQENRLLTN